MEKRMKNIMLLIFMLAFSNVSFGTTFRDSTLTIGKKDTVDKELILNGTVKRGLKSNNVSGKLEFTHNGVDYKTLGSGSGSGGGGENYNNAFSPEQNANAEDGVLNWTFSGGTFEATSTDPLEGDKSFNWTPSAQNDYVDSPVLNFNKDILKGRSCQVNIEYIGGDENLGLQVINGNDEVIASFRNSNSDGENKLPKHTVTAIESVGFICPTGADILADSEKGNLRTRIINLGATSSELIKFDKNYSGTLIGLTETTLPDLLSVDVSSTLDIINNDTSWMDNCFVSGSDVQCNFSSGVFSTSPSCNADSGSVNSNSNFCKVKAVTSSGATVHCQNSSSQASVTSEAFSLFCIKQGADAKQTVQVYKSIPKVSENINSFTARIDNSGGVGNENTDWISGVASKSDTSLYTIIFVSGLFSLSPTCSVSEYNSDTGLNSEAKISGEPSSFGLTVRTGFSSTASSFTKSPLSFSITCNRSLGDFKMPTAQPVIVGQVENSYASSGKQVRVEGCRVSNTGTPVTDSSLCNSWLDSLGDNGVGRTILNYSGKFSSPPICTVVPQSVSSVRACYLRSETTLSEIEVLCQASDSNTDMDFEILCIGDK